MATRYRELLTQLNQLRRALENEQRMNADEQIQALIVARCSATERADLEAKVAACMSDLETKIAALGTEVDAEYDLSCPRCMGTGQYQGPTSHHRAGSPVCFQCHGTGERKPLS